MSKTYFISGHRDISKVEFALCYITTITGILESEPDAKFVVGDYGGVDEMANTFLRMAGVENVTCYHMFVAPRHNPGNYPTKGGYTSDEERDAAMTRESDEDIAWVRAGKEKSGTARNLERRKELM